MADRCTGRCCRDFIIRRSPEELKEDAATATPEWKKEFTKIAEMVIHLNDGGDGYHHHYTCKHFDINTNNCTDYENRPDMCRNFPYGDPCPFHDECEWNPDSPRPDVSLKKLRYSARSYRVADATTREVGDKVTFREAVSEFVEAKSRLQRPRCDQRHRREEKLEDALSRRTSRTSGQPEVVDSQTDQEARQLQHAHPPLRERNDGAL